MKILHTSDWHLGRSLYGRKRYNEFESFLEWLSITIKAENIDVLLVAGDVFDTTTPSNRAQHLYYSFLGKISHSSCRHIVIIAGNHDSPSFLTAPKKILHTLNVYVIGSITENLEDEVLVLNNKHDAPEVIICAVPYIRDKDIRIVEPNETIQDKNAKLIEGIRNHYNLICSIAKLKQKKLLTDYPSTFVPIVAMGHLFTSGGKTLDDDGVRELYIGSLAHLNKEIFSSSIDYLALGHLHIPQKVNKSGNIRYSGAPIAMGYGEKKQEKQIIVIEFNTKKPTIYKILVPCFQPLERIVGSLESILQRIDYLTRKKSNAWLEIEYTGLNIISDLRELLYKAVNGTLMEIRRIKNKQIINKIFSKINENENLDELNVNDVFEKCLDAFNVPSEEWSEITQLHNEIIKSIHEEDINAE